MQKELNEIIELHVKWLRGEKGGNYADLRDAVLRGANLRGADLRDAVLRGADLRGADLSNTNIGGADLRGADLRGAVLGGADLRDAVLRGADLRGADLRDAVLRGADLRGANLRGADLRGADLSNTNLGGACLDKTYYQITRIGSRKGTTTYCVEDDNVTCGCWNYYKGGTLQEFKARVESVYGSARKTPHEKYYAEYLAAIKFFEEVRGE